MYKFYQKKLTACNKQIDRLIKEELKKDPFKKKLKTTNKPYKRINKNAPNIKNLNKIAFKYFNGVDLFAIEGLSHATVLSIMSEIGSKGF